MSDVCNSCGSAGIVENLDPRAEQVTTVRPCQYCIAPRVTLLCDRCRIHHESVCKVNAARLGRGEGATVRTQPTLRTVPTTPVRPEIFADTPVEISKLEVTAEELENFRVDDDPRGPSPISGAAFDILRADDVVAEGISGTNSGRWTDVEPSVEDVPRELVTTQEVTEVVVPTPEAETEITTTGEDVKVVNPDEEVSNQES